MTTDITVVAIFIGVAGALLLIIGIFFKLYKDGRICKKRKQKIEDFSIVEEIKKRLHKHMDSETQVSFKDFEDKRILPYRDLNGRIATINLAIEKDVTGAQEMVHQKEINRLHNWLMDGDHRNIKDAESIIFGKNL